LYFKKRNDAKSFNFGLFETETEIVQHRTYLLETLLKKNNITVPRLWVVHLLPKLQLLPALQELPRSGQRRLCRLRLRFVDQKSFHFLRFFKLSFHEFGKNSTFMLQELAVRW
jgi:hypothetical protein